MSTYTLNPIVATSSSGWTYESSAITNDNLWAVNGTHTNAKLKLSSFAIPILPPEFIVTGFAINIEAGNVDHSGSPGTSPGEGEFCRIRIGLSRDGTNYVGTTWDLDITAGTIFTTVGGEGELHGYSGWRVDDLSLLYILIQRPTDLVDEYVGGNRSVDRCSLTMYVGLPSDLEILSLHGGCDGEVHVSWSA